MRQVLADFDELRNCLAVQAFDTLMNVERPIARTEATMKHMLGWSDLPPTQAGLAAALRRAFDIPADEQAREFEKLLSRIC
jgi:hypothetical protein